MGTTAAGGWRDGTSQPMDTLEGQDHRGWEEGVKESQKWEDE